MGYRVARYGVGLSAPADSAHARPAGPNDVATPAGAEGWQALYGYSLPFSAARREYEESIVQTFYLSNADLKETIDLLRVVIDIRQISPTTSTNSATRTSCLTLSGVLCS